MDNYNESSIKQLSGLQHIRHRPSGYLIDSDVNGLMGITKELVDNSVDELAIVGEGGKLNIIMFIDEDKRSYQVCVVDNGRGIPVAKLIDVFSNTLTSGKFDTSNYSFSSGTYGIGSSVTLALSKWFRAISLNKGIIGDVTFVDNHIPEEIVTTTNRTDRTGTIVVHEPDELIFTGIDDFIYDHSKLSDYLIQLSLFGKYRILFTTINHGISKDIRESDTLEFLAYIDNICQNVTQEYDSATLDRDLYIRNFFGVSKKWDSVIHIDSVELDGKLRVEGDIRISTVNISSGNNKLTMVNDILFTDNNSLHIKLLHDFVKSHVAINISDKSVKSFFLDQYKLPIWLVLNIKYAGAQFSGLAKTSFRDSSFKHPYQILLTKALPQQVINHIYEIIKDHIEISYARFSNNDLKVSNLKHLLAKLIRPEKFSNCSTTDRSKAELFLVEGDSAKSDQDRDSIFQASYTLGGKPFNGLTTIDKLSESANDIKKNAVFQDIIKILNIIPGSNDLTKMNFGKILIMADADTHGYHITNIVLGNLYAICPALIEGGYVYVIIPPLYSLTSKGNDPIYIRNESELNAILAYQLYYRCLDIRLESVRFNKSLAREEFVYFSEIVSRIGGELNRLSQEYMIPALLLELLSLMTTHLNLKKPDVDLMKDYLPYELRYIKQSNLLIVSIGMEDIVVPLTQITDLIYDRILPLYREFYYGKTRLFVTTKNSNALIDAPTTIVQLNEIFNKLASIFTINRFKGLGSMPPSDRSRTCTNPLTRRVYRVTSLGDLDTIFDMLGNDPSSRKKLVIANGGS